MEPEPIEQVVRNIDLRLSHVVQILPTLATKVELTEAIAPLATKVELTEAIAPLATKVELAEAIAPQATKVELAEAIAPLATKVELTEAIAPLATKVELAEAIAPLATKVELAEAIAPLATKAEMREEGERTRRHFDVVAEALESRIKLVAEGVTGLGERMDWRFDQVESVLMQHDRRLMVLEAGRQTRPAE